MKVIIGYSKNLSIIRILMAIAIATAFTIGFVFWNSLQPAYATTATVMNNTTATTPMPNNMTSEEEEEEPLPYCDVLKKHGINSGDCFDRYDIDEVTGLASCNDGTQRQDPLDYPDASLWGKLGPEHNRGIKMDLGSGDEGAQKAAVDKAAEAEARTDVEYSEAVEAESESAADKDNEEEDESE